MQDSRAFTHFIKPFGSGMNENGDVHQSAPAWVLTFVRWENRDTQRVKNVPFSEVRDPLVVENDCLQVTVNVSKGTLTPSMNAVLIGTDVNYETSVSPGDFVFVNMLNWEKDARRVGDNARANLPLNGINDGFKGVFKVQSVRKVLSVDPNTGTKMLLYKITGFGFTEFNNTIYFNPFMLDPNQDPQNQLLFSSYIGNNWTTLINDKGTVNVQDIMAVLIQSLIGDGISDQGRNDKQGNVISPNVHFFVPALVGKFLGINGAKAAKDIYNYIFGLQKYGSGSQQSLASGMNPSGLYEKFNRFFYSPTPCSGDSLLKPEYWNQVKTWAILNQYTNAPLNELYTCFRVSPNGKVMPTLVFRQIPFTNEDFESGLQVTRFMNVPRWKVHPSLILGLDIGRDEAARINFVQYFGKSTISTNGAEISAEIARKNYLYDISDVQRSGLRPYIVTTQFDELTSVKKDYLSPEWAKIVGDSLIGGHLKLNGTVDCVGIVDPIAVGDNFELDGTVYHIEQISHTATISPFDGRRMFRTSISVSSGIHKSSSVNGTRYSEMTNTVAYRDREDDFKNKNQILPGISETQDVVYRPWSEVDGGEPSKEQIKQPNKSYPQPGKNIKKQKDE